MIPSELKYTEEHEWVKKEDDIAIIGITEHASEELGEVVYVELPKIESTVSQADECGSIESVKTLSSVYAPVSGEVIEINQDVIDNPDTINDSPLEDGWLVKLKLFDENELDDLMTYEEYQTYLENL